MPYVGIDFGSKRIGLATSNSGDLAQPHSVVMRDRGLEPVVDAIRSVADSIGAKTLVLGIPSGGRLSDSPGLHRYAGFADLLRQRTGLEVILWDEAYSTTEAAAALRDAGRKGKDARKRIDMAAAAVILQSYLDASRRRQP